MLLKLKSLSQFNEKGYNLYTTLSHDAPLITTARIGSIMRIRKRVNVFILMFNHCYVNKYKYKMITKTKKNHKNDLIPNVINPHMS